MSATITELSEWTGISDRTLARWRRKGAIPERGATLQECIQAVVKHYQERLEKAEGNTLPPKEQAKRDRIYEAKVKETEARARKLDLENKVTEGNLMVADEAMEAWGQYVGHCRAKLLALPSRIASECSEQPALKIQAIATDIVYEALTELAQGMPTEGQEVNPM